MMKVKLIIDKHTNKVLYAEARKDFVDFLLHVLMKPLGLAMKEDFAGGSSGGLANLFTSAEACSFVHYFLDGSSTSKAFRDPKFLETHTCTKCKDSLVDRVCYSCKSYVVHNEPKFCFGHGNSIKGVGYVKWEVMYMITDDLVLKPLSTGDSMKLLSELGVRDIGCVEESEVTIDYNKVMELLKAASTSKTVLTDFLLPLRDAK